MKFVKVFIMLALLAGVTIAAPVKTWNWTGPTHYVDESPIPASDAITYEMACSSTSGGPYDVIFPVTDPEAPPLAQDMGSLVQGVPGTFYCVLTAISTVYATRSGYSNEGNFTVTAADLGLVPKAPINFRLQ